MKRTTQAQTLHGTFGGQVPVDPKLKSAYGLTERPSQCAALLRHGVTPQRMAEMIGVAPSTLEKHVAALRTKLNLASTADLINFLQDREAAVDAESFHVWPPALMHSGGDRGAATAALEDRLHGAVQLQACLEAMRDHLLKPFGIRHIYYCFLPLANQGFMRGDYIDYFLAPDVIADAFRASGGLIAQPIAQYLIANPDCVAFNDMQSPESKTAPAPTRKLYDACGNDGARYTAAFGFPNGGALVGCLLTMDADIKNAKALIDREGEALRNTAMLVQSYAWNYGALAAHIGLTVRERDALSGLARGLKAVQAAAEMKISERAFGKMIANAREKFNARTNAEAIYKAAAVNALVFY